MDCQAGSVILILSCGTKYKRDRERSTALGLYEAPFVVFITGSARTVAHWQISLLRSLALVMAHI